MIKITSPQSSFMQFASPENQPFLDAFGICFPEIAKFNVAFQFTVTDTVDGFRPTTENYFVSILSNAGVFKQQLQQCVPLFNRVHLAYADDSMNLISITIGSVTIEYNRLVTRSELIDELRKNDIIAFDAVTYIWYREVNPIDLIIRYLDVDDIPQEVQVSRFLETLYADIEIDMAAIVAAGECYRYSITKSDHTILAQSQSFIRMSTSKYISLFRYWNDEDAMGFIYSAGPQIINRISLPIYVAKPQYPSSKKVYKKSNSTIKTLYASIEKEWPLETDHFPNWMHECLVAALHHDYFDMVINDKWVGLSNDGQDYKIDWVEEQVDKGKGAIKLKQQLYNYLNYNIGNIGIVCGPPFVKVISADPAHVVFELYPTLSAKKFQFRYRQSGTEIWSAPVTIEYADYNPHQYDFDISAFGFAFFEYQFRSYCTDSSISEWGVIKQFATGACDQVTILSGEDLGTGNAGTHYTHQIILGGTQPFVLNVTTVPAWMNITLVFGNKIVLTGTPPDAATYPVEFTVTNCSGDGELNFTGNVVVAEALPEPMGIVEVIVAQCGGGSVTIKNMDTNVEYNIDAVDCGGQLEVPYGTYLIKQFYFDACASPLIQSCDPELGTIFILAAGSDTYSITLNCL
jgi:hypothetical protein